MNLKAIDMAIKAGRQERYHYIVRALGNGQRRSVTFRHGLASREGRVVYQYTKNVIGTDRDKVCEITLPQCSCLNDIPIPGFEQEQ